MHLFIVCPNNSGSTLLAELIGTSRNAAMFTSTNREGQWVAKAAGDGIMPFPEGMERRNWTVNIDRFADPLNYDWERLKSAWESNWDAARPIRVEKTPSLVVSAPLFGERFEDSRFILSIRNPYAFCEGIRRREGYCLETAATHWVRCAELQIRNREVLHPALCFTYEELCDDPARVAGRIVEFVPELADMDTGRVFDIMSCRSSIANQNASQIARLSLEDIDAINHVLIAGQPVVRALGYEIMNGRAYGTGNTRRTADPNAGVAGLAAGG